MNDVIESIEQNPIIAAVRNQSKLDHALCQNISTIFMLHANIFNIQEMIERTKDAGKNVFIHMDFLEGFGRDKTAVEYVVKNIKPDGIISTKTNHIKYANEMGCYTIQRFFMVDSQSYEQMIKNVKSVMPDMIEVMPGVIPKVIRSITKKLDIPVIAGGLITSKQDVMDALKSGAIAVSTGNQELWKI